MTDEKNTSLVTVESARPILLRPIGNAQDALKAKSEMRGAIMAFLEEGVDVIVIPGTSKKGEPPKKVLSKAGAENVNFLFGTHPEFDIVEQEVDHDRPWVVPSSWVEAPEPDKNTKERMRANKTGRSKNVGGDNWVWLERGEGTETVYGLYRFMVRCRIVAQNGLVVGSCLAVCSTLESKYSSRPREVENTVLKMAEKRAFVGATLHAFSLSDRLTQDIEDFVRDEGAEAYGFAGGAPAPARPTRADDSRPNQSRGQTQDDKRGTNGSQRTSPTPRNTANDATAPATEKRSPPAMDAGAFMAKVMAHVEGAQMPEDLDAVSIEWVDTSPRIPASRLREGIGVALRAKRAQLVDEPWTPTEADATALKIATAWWADRKSGKADGA